MAGIECQGCIHRDKTIQSQNEDIHRLLEDTKRSLEISANQLALDQDHYAEV